MTPHPARPLLATLALLAACAPLSTTRQEQPFTPTVSVAAGASRSEYNADWEPVDEVSMAHLGVAGVPEGPRGGLSWEAQLSLGEEDDGFQGFEVDSEHTLLGGGARYTWFHGRVRPFVGGGAELDHAEVEIEGSGFRLRDDDTALGLYLHAGLELDVDAAGRWFAGVDARVGGLGAEHEFFFARNDSDYGRMTLWLGRRF